MTGISTSIRGYAAELALRAQPKVMRPTTPRMLDVLPFLSPQVKSESLDARFPLDHGIKAVHLWNWYNPLIASSGSTRQSLQLNARLKHKCMWHWYDLWWRLHQELCAVSCSSWERLVGLLRRAKPVPVELPIGCGPLEHQGGAQSDADIHFRIHV